MLGKIGELEGNKGIDKAKEKWEKVQEKRI